VGGLGVIKFIKIILLWLLFSPSIFAATYYIAATGGNDGNDGLSSGAPIATFTHAYTHLTAGDTLILLNGTYTIALAPLISGTTGNPITFQGQTYGSVYIDPSSAGSAIAVHSNNETPVGYLTFQNIIARGNGEYPAVNVNGSDDATEINMVHNIIMQKVGAFGSAQETNTAVFSIGNNARDCLFEDIFSYGRGRKALQAFGSLRITIRRAVIRYDYWEGDSYIPTDPRDEFSGYNTEDSIFEDIIAIDSAPTPSGYSGDRNIFTSSGNATPANVTRSAGNKYFGLLAMNCNYGNGIEINGGSSEDPNYNNAFKDIIIWNPQYYGINVYNNDDLSNVTYSTVYSAGLRGFVVNPSPASPVTNVTMQYNFSYNNANGDMYGAETTYSNNTCIGTGCNTEPSYAPTMTYVVQPAMVEGHERGGTMDYRYVDGTLTGTRLWPWPEEDVIRDNMCNATDLAESNRVSGNGAGWEPSWCASTDTLTTFVWEYAGGTIPEDIYDDSPAEDTIDPIVAISDSDPKTLSSGYTTTLGFTSSDANGIDECKWRSGSAPDESNGTLCTGTTSGTCSVTGLVQGDQIIHVGCKDASENANWNDDSITVNAPSYRAQAGGSFNIR
jgi:hypothetical protein